MQHLHEVAPADAIDGQIAAMRRLLTLMSNPSAADAWKALRAAFPNPSLATRTATIAGRRL